MKKFKKVVALTMAASMAAAPAVFADGEKTEITISAIDFNAGQSNTGDNAEEILNMIKDYTDTDLQITWTLNDVLDEKNNLMLNNPSTMPMIMTFGGSLTGSVASAAKAGAFVNLNDYMWDEEKYPNLSQANKSVCDSLTVDGQLIGIYRARDIGRYGLTYRKDWAEKLGIEEPKTVDDVYEMLRAFTEDDPDGNGENDTYGMEMTNYTGPFDIIQTWFGCGNGWADVDGKLVPVFQQEEYMEALNWLKKVYENGYMPSDWVARTSDTWSNETKNGKAGVYIDVLDGGRRIWDYYVQNNIPSVSNPDELASVALVGTINGHTLATSGYNGYFTLSSTTCDTPEKIEAALHFLDKMNDNDMMILCGYGLEGINYEITDDGFINQLDTADDKKNLQYNYKGLNQLIPYIPSSATDPDVEQNERIALQKQVIADNADYAVMNPALKYLANSQTYSELGSTLDQLISNARNQYICGEIDEDGLKAAWDNWASQGGDSVIAEVNEQYESDKALAGTDAEEATTEEASTEAK